MKNNLTFRITLAAVLTAFALVSFMLESLFPPLFIPGARLGVSNVFVLIAVICLGVPYGFAVLIVKSLLGSLLIGNFAAVVYSLPAGLTALSVEIALLYLKGKVSVVAVSVLGGTLNLTVQNLVFCGITGGAEYLVYLPYLTVIGALSGAFVGFAVYLIIKFLPEQIIAKLTLDQENKK